MEWKYDAVTVQIAFVAMIKFLEHQYQLTKSDDLGALLGGLRLLRDGGPMDPAFKDDWLHAIEDARQFVATQFPDSRTS